MEPRPSGSLRRSDRPYDRLSVAFRLGRCMCAQGTWHQAIRMLEQAWHLCQCRRHPASVIAFVAPIWRYAYAQAAVRRGAPAVRSQIGESARPSVLPSRSPGSARSVVWRGACEEADRLTPASGLDHARQRTSGARRRGLCGSSALPCPADPPDVAQAEAHYQQALALAEELGMRPLQAHCHHGLGTLYARIGRQEHARAAMTTAIALYRAMDMTFWLPQAEAALAQAGRGEEPVEASLVALPPRPA